MAPLLSIIIPTRNRSKYCIECLKHIISLKLDNIEIIIQDNSDTNELKHLIEANYLGNLIKYNLHSEVLSFVRNFSMAVEAASGEYMIMIGDDDTVLPNIVEIASIAEQRNYDAVIPKLNCYFWPSPTPIVPKYVNGYLVSCPYKHKKFIKVDTFSSLKSLIADNFQNYQFHGIPRVYHGIVSKKALEKVKIVAGDYFKGLTPDMFMSIALCFTAPNAYIYTQPISISGICPKSGSNDSATGKHTGQLKDAPHFRGHDSYDWCKDVPAIYTVETIWAETALQALNFFDDGTYRSLYDKKRFAGYLKEKYPQFHDELCHFVEGHPMASQTVYKISHTCQKYFDKLVRLATNEYARHYYGITDISSACDILTKLYRLDK